MTRALLISRKYKNKLAAKKLKNPNNINIEKYKKYNSLYKSLIRKAKLNYYANKFQEYAPQI